MTFSARVRCVTNTVQHTSGEKNGGCARPLPATGTTVIRSNDRAERGTAGPESYAPLRLLLIRARDIIGGVQPR